MIELDPSQFPIAQPLFAGMHAILPDAILEGVNLGRAFVDRIEQPSAALLWTTCGYFFLGGHTDDPVVVHAVAHTLHEVLVPASKALGESGFILYPNQAAWLEKIPELLPGKRFFQIFRRTFHLDRSAFAALGNWRARIPVGLSLRCVDQVLIERVQGGLAAEIGQFWRSPADFLAHGLGFCLLDGDEVLSQCMAVFSSSTGMEISISTPEPHRRKGSAFLVAAAFIEACLEQGKHPNWECFWDNQPSNSLAEKLGYKMINDVPVYYWEA